MTLTRTRSNTEAPILSALPEQPMGARTLEPSAAMPVSWSGVSSSASRARRRGECRGSTTSSRTRADPAGRDERVNAVCRSVHRRDLASTGPKDRCPLLSVTANSARSLSSTGAVDAAAACSSSALFARNLTAPAAGLERRLPFVRIGLELLLTVSRAKVEALALIFSAGPGVGLVYFHSTYGIACHVYLLAIVDSVPSLQREVEP